MAKAPAFQFYVADFDQDTRCLSLEACGAWIRCLIYMWRSETRGEITHTLTEFARLFSCSITKAEKVISELIEKGICDYFLDGERNANVTRVTLRSKKVTLRNRRMYREAQASLNHANRQDRYRQRRALEKETAKSDAEVTHPSSPSPSGNINHANNFISHSDKRREKGEAIPKDFSLTEEMREYAQRKAPHVDIETATEKFINHALTHDRRCVNWDRAWMNWILKAEEVSPNGKSTARETASKRNADTRIETERLLRGK